MSRFLKKSGLCEITDLRVKYHNEQIGYNSRLDEIQAAFLSIKLPHLDKINQHKRKLAMLYLEGLKNDFIKPLSRKIILMFTIFSISAMKSGTAEGIPIKE